MDLLAVGRGRVGEEDDGLLGGHNEWRCVVVVLVEDGRDKGGIEKAMDLHVDMHP